MSEIIKIEKLNKIYRDRPGEVDVILKDINFEISDGEFFVLVGPSGCGKSTILRILAGLDKDYSGEVMLGARGQELEASFVFQSFALLPWLTVYENIALAGTAHEQVMNEIKKLGLERYTHGYPRELSGGMKQRVGIARALVTNPKIIFMDEPFSELDSFTAQELRREVLNIWRERHMTIVMVTHIVPEAIELADRIAVMTPRPGKIEKIVANPLPRPRQTRTPDFFHLEDEITRLVKP